MRDWKLFYFYMFVWILQITSCRFLSFPFTYLFVLSIFWDAASCVVSVVSPFSALLATTPHTISTSLLNLLLSSASLCKLITFLLQPAKRKTEQRNDSHKWKKMGNIPSWRRRRIRRKWRSIRSAKAIREHYNKHVNKQIIYNSC